MSSPSSNFRPNSNDNQNHFNRIHAGVDPATSSFMTPPPRPKLSSSSGIQMITSSRWISDDTALYCTACRKQFHDIFNRRHHCRLCGKIFCHSCTSQRALIPPSSIVLIPKGGRKVKSRDRVGWTYEELRDYQDPSIVSDRLHQQQQEERLPARVTFEEDQDPDCMVTYLKREKVDKEKKQSNLLEEELEEDNYHSRNDTKPTYEDPEKRSLLGSENERDNMSDAVMFDEILLSDQTHTQPRKDLFAQGYRTTASITDLEDSHRDTRIMPSVTSIDLSYCGAKEDPLHAAIINDHRQLKDMNQIQVEKSDSSNFNATGVDTNNCDDDDDDDENHEEETTLLYGKGLEERIKLAREPLRVCLLCYEQLQHVQEELRLCNSNAMRYNAIDPTDARRLLNSPLAFTLGHEIRKAAYTLNNLLPLPKRMGVLMPSSSFFYGEGSRSRFATTNVAATTEQCQNTCTAVSGNLSTLDGVRIPARLLERAKGVAVMTVIKGGLGFAGFEFGTGLVVARLGDGREWSPPCAIGTAGVSWGALIGAQVSDHVFLLMTDAAVDIMSNNDGSFQLGADIGVAVGPLGRSLEADISAASGTSGDPNRVAMAPIYTYSLSKGLYAGISLDGKVIVTRHRVNENFYGHQVDARALLSGELPTPPAAQPLYDALKRCHVYAGAGYSDRKIPSSSGYHNQTLNSMYYEYNMNSRDFSQNSPYM